MPRALQELTFEVPRNNPPYSNAYDDALTVQLLLPGPTSPREALSPSEIQRCVRDVLTGFDATGFPPGSFDQGHGTAAPSLEEVAMRLWRRLETEIAGLERITVRRVCCGEQHTCTVSDGVSANAG